MRSRGFPEALGLIDRLPETERDLLGEMLTEFAVEISAAQKAAAPEQSGHLASGLEAEVMIEQLRMRAGLLSIGRGRNSRYYGRFVEFGRRGQTVLVTRGTTASPKSASTRRRLKRGANVRKPYTMKVKPMAPRPFVYLPDTEARVDRRLAEFWSEALPA